MTEYPEHEKLSKVKDTIDAVGDFMDWINNGRKHPMCLFSWHPPEVEEIGFGSWSPSTIPISTLLAEYFGVDTTALENEKKTMLEAYRNLRS